MTDVLLLTNTDDDATRVLPALTMLHDGIRVAPADPSAALALSRGLIVLVDGRTELPAARHLCRVLKTTDDDHAVLTIVTEGGLADVNGDWQLDDLVVNTASPAEVAARLRLARARLAPKIDAPTATMQHGVIQIEPATRTVTVRGRKVGMTYQEFELLAHLAEQPGRVFSRAELLTQVWGHQYAGGSRTVDVHVRRVRVALGDEHADHIGTVRRVGYKFVPDPWRPGHQESHQESVSPHATTTDWSGALPDTPDVA